MVNGDGYGAVRTAGREVKFLDPCKTSNCESRWPVHLRQSGTKLRLMKTIRYRRNPERKRYRLRIG